MQGPLQTWSSVRLWQSFPRNPLNAYAILVSMTRGPCSRTRGYPWDILELGCAGAETRAEGNVDLVGTAPVSFSPIVTPSLSVSVPPSSSLTCCVKRGTQSIETGRLARIAHFEGPGAPALDVGLADFSQSLHAEPVSVEVPRASQSDVGLANFPPLPLDSSIKATLPTPTVDFEIMDFHGVSSTPHDPISHIPFPLEPHVDKHLVDLSQLTRCPDFDGRSSQFTGSSDHEGCSSSASTRSPELVDDFARRWSYRLMTSRMGWPFHHHRLPSLRWVPLTSQQLLQPHGLIITRQR